MGNSQDPRKAAPQETEVEVLPPLENWHGGNDRITSFERMIHERDQRIALLELHQQETDHRVKNSLQVVATLVRAQTRSGHEVDIERLAANVSERIGLIARIHDLLTRRRTGAVDLGDLLIDLCGKTARLLDSSSSPIIEVDTVECDLTPQCAAALALIVHELILNSYKHANSQGAHTRVAVRLRHSSEDIISIIVEDDGRGSPPESEAAASGMGMGLLRTIAHSVGAIITGHATDAGCRFTVDLPVAGNVAAPITPSY